LANADLAWIVCLATNHYRVFEYRTGAIDTADDAIAQVAVVKVGTILIGDTLRTEVFSRHTCAIYTTISDGA